ncbi:hypothetical protein FOXYSP1_19351 [Fusarium oxysporum f. sp. phaseoli]
MNRAASILTLSSCNAAIITFGTSKMTQKQVTRIHHHPIKKCPT